MHCVGLIEALLRLAKISSNYNSGKGSQILCSGENNHELLHQCTKILSTRILITTDVVFHRNVLKLLSYLVQNAKFKSKLEAEYKELAENRYVNHLIQNFSTRWHSHKCQLILRFF